MSRGVALGGATLQRMHGANLEIDWGEIRLGDD
jgi:hypothetical protein